MTGGVPPETPCVASLRSKPGNKKEWPPKPGGHSFYVIPDPSAVIPGPFVVIPGSFVVIPGPFVVIPGLTRNLLPNRESHPENPVKSGTTTFVFEGLSRYLWPFLPGNRQKPVVLGK